jgi:hypothetical protein
MDPPSNGSIIDCTALRESLDPNVKDRNLSEAGLDPPSNGGTIDCTALRGSLDHSLKDKNLTETGLDPPSNGGTIDCTALRGSLDPSIKDRNLSEKTGLCPERHELYKDCFDDMIIEITNVDSEKGELFSRIRDELNTTSDCYKKLYESSVSFGLNKAIAARAQNEKLHSKIEQVLDEKRTLLDENQYLKRKLNAAKKDEETKRFIINWS